MTRPRQSTTRVTSSLAGSAALGLGLVAMLGMAGCGSASASAKAKGEAGTEKKDAFAVEGSAWTMDQEGAGADADPDVPDQPAAGAKKKPAVTPATAKKAGPSGEPALLGARHDVSLGKGAPALCKCLAVVIGPANAPGLSWASTQPIVDSSSQLVIALGSEDVTCDQPSSGASYMGYEREGANVVVQVEAARPGRPVTHGAIIPKPAAGGQVLIQGVGGVPFGKGPAGEPRCTVGTVGAASKKPGSTQ